MGVRGALRRLRCELSGRTAGPLPRGLWEPLEGAKALELGGPSACFGREGLLPVYPLLGELDGVQPRAQTLWHDLDPAEGYVVDGERRGALLIEEDIELAVVPDGVYDAVISSHVIEHIANPLLALAAWRRVSVPEGHLLIVAPHMAGTFDHRRTLTPLRHMVADFEARTAEDDLTHLEEVLETHDSERDIRSVDDPDFVSELRENPRTRALHHHTFTTVSLIDLLTQVGLQVVAVETRLPHDIYLLARWVAHGERPANGRIAIAAAARSPFRVDRRAAKELGLGLADVQI